MPLRSIGLASDVLVMRDQSVLEEHPDRFVLRSPDEPTFWFGNMVIFREDAVDPDAQIAQFKKDFPDAQHVTLAWDVPDIDQGDRFAAFKQMGMKLEETDVLAFSGTLHRTDPPEGIVVRPLVSDDDWQKATDLQAEIGRESGFDDDYLPYITKRMQTQRKQTQTGFGAWFGAFAGDELAGDLGIFADPRTARFQAVETRPSYRRRGICAALVTAGTEWALAKHPNTCPTILAERDGAAGRIYRRCGFELAECLIATYRGPEKDA